VRPVLIGAASVSAAAAPPATPPPSGITATNTAQAAPPARGSVAWSVVLVRRASSRSARAGLGHIRGDRYRDGGGLIHGGSSYRVGTVGAK